MNVCLLKTPSPIQLTLVATMVYSCYKKLDIWSVLIFILNEYFFQILSTIPDLYSVISKATVWVTELKLEENNETQWTERLWSVGSASEVQHLYKNTAFKIVLDCMMRPLYWHIQNAMCRLVKYFATFIIISTWLVGLKINVSNSKLYRQQTDNELDRLR